MTLSNSTYDKLKYIAQIVLPALATLYFAVAGIWGLPYAEEVVGTITAVDAFLGAILMFSSNSYTPPTDGTINIIPNGEAYASFESDINDKDGGQVTLDVKSILTD